MLVDNVADYQAQFSKWWAQEWKAVTFPERVRNLSASSRQDLAASVLLPGLASGPRRTSEALKVDTGGKLSTTEAERLKSYLS